jgi:hypothetical protein
VKLVRTIGVISCLIAPLTIGAIFGAVSQANHIRASCDSTAPETTRIAGNDYFCVDAELLRKAQAQQAARAGRGA